MKLQLTLACGAYDRTLPLMEGTVQPEGIELNTIAMEPFELFERQARHAEFDVSEFALSTHAILRARGDDRMLAIPVFPSRKFRHGDIYINTRAGIERPQDLVGKRVGAMEYQQTAAVWIRGMLQQEYGVSADQVHWFFGGYNSPGKYTERIPITLPSNVRVTTIPDQHSLDQLLDAGEIDALIGAQQPNSFRRRSPNVGRLFPNAREMEIEYYRRTGIFPIMHIVVVKREVYERAPWVAVNLSKAFEQAKAVGNARLRHTGVLFGMLPWLNEHLEETDALMGPDPFQYGLEKNRLVLETFLQYEYEQGLTQRRLEITDLFAPETIPPG